MARPRSGDGAVDGGCSVEKSERHCAASRACTHQSTAPLHQGTIGTRSPTEGDSRRSSARENARGRSDGGRGRASTLGRAQCRAEPSATRVPSGSLLPGLPWPCSLADRWLCARTHDASQCPCCTTTSHTWQPAEARAERGSAQRATAGSTSRCAPRCAALLLSPRDSLKQ